MTIDVIILDAGLSKRMSSYSKGVPKALLTLYDNYSILDYQVSVVSRYLHAIRHILLVVGYRKDMFFRHVNNYKQDVRKRIKFVVNELYSQTDNAYSVFLATRELNADSLIILDGDVLFHPTLFERLVKPRCGICTIVDFDAEITEEDSKVLVKDDYVQKIGKRVNGNGIYCSMIMLSGNFLKKFIGELQNSVWWTTWYSEPLNILLKKEPNVLRAIPTNGLPRMDIDTPKEFLEAKKFFARFQTELKDIFS